jgi:hypothetical protein
VYAFLADHRQQLFPPELFADVARQGGGHASVPAEVIATVMVLQALEGLSDREAISALRRDIAWKVACGLRLDDEGFHPTVLVYWRNRLRASERPRRIFEAVRQVVAAQALSLVVPQGLGISVEANLELTTIYGRLILHRQERELPFSPEGHLAKNPISGDASPVDLCGDVVPSATSSTIKLEP